MTVRIVRLALLLAALCSATVVHVVHAAAAQASAAQSTERGPLRRSTPVPVAEDASNARVIVQFRAGSALVRAPGAKALALRPQHAAALGRRLSLPLVDGRVLGGRMQALRGVGLSSSQLAARLAAQADVEWAVPDRRKRLLALPNDPYIGPGQSSITPAVGQWYLRAPDATAVSAINAVAAWDITPGRASITVAVLDTGVRMDHPDLAGKLHPGYDFVHDRATGNDGNGRDADASDPGDWTASNECGAGEAATSSSWHGTQVAGIVGAATDNGQGMAGIGRQVMVLPVRVLGRCGGFDSDIIAAMRWAGGVSADPVPNANPARVINLSLGSSGTCDASYRAVIAELSAAGVTVVAAAGNDTGQSVLVPGNCPGVIAVAGVRHAGSKVGYSNIGPEVALAAPAGNCVNLSGACLYPLLSTYNTGTTSPAAHSYSDSFEPTLGTSFASPIVAGVVGLMLSVDPSLTPARIRTALRATARAFPTSGPDPAVQACRRPDGVDQLECYCTANTCGAGLLDANGAVTAALAGSTVGVQADRVFNYLEFMYPQYVAPRPAQSVAGAGYYYRYYASTHSYVGLQDGRVYYLVPAINDQINLLGDLSEWLAIAAAAGF